MRIMWEFGRAAVVLVAISAMSQACSSSNEIAGPPSGQSSRPPDSLATTGRILSITPITPNSRTIFPGEQVGRPPAVQVLNARDFSPVAGIHVTFTAAGGTVTISKALTDSQGIARVDDWRPDYSKPTDTVVATADGVSGEVTFTANVVQKTPVAIYDLALEGGMGLPISVPGAQSKDRLTGGHYLLFGDGTFVTGYEINGQLVWSVLNPFIRVNSTTVEFYLDPGMPPDPQLLAKHNYLLSTGTFIGNTMAVYYQDPLYYYNEVYSLRQ